MIIKEPSWVPGGLSMHLFKNWIKLEKEKKERLVGFGIKEVYFKTSTLYFTWCSVLAILKYVLDSEKV